MVHLLYVVYIQLVAVYEVLKDERKRTRYNEILISGLPDWRMPVYYYRRVRKLGLLELSIVLLIISTVGHFLVIWSVYLEKKFVTVSEKLYSNNLLICSRLIGGARRKELEDIFMQIDVFGSAALAS